MCFLLFPFYTRIPVPHLTFYSRRTHCTGFLPGKRRWRCRHGIFSGWFLVLKLNIVVALFLGIYSEMIFCLQLCNHTLCYHYKNQCNLKCFSLLMLFHITDWQNMDPQKDWLWGRQRNQPLFEAGCASLTDTAWASLYPSSLICPGVGAFPGGHALQPVHPGLGTTWDFLMKTTQ